MTYVPAGTIICPDTVQTRVLGEQKISAGDVDLMIMTDDPREAARIVVDAYEAQQHPDAPRLEKV